MAFFFFRLFKNRIFLTFCALPQCTAPRPGGSFGALAADFSKVAIAVPRTFVALRRHSRDHPSSSRCVRITLLISFSHFSLIKNVKDRPGHDRRYAVNPDQIIKKLGWLPKTNFEDGLKKTVSWYLNNLDWCDSLMKKSGYSGGRIGNIN